MTPAVDTLIATATRPDGALVTLAAMAPTTWRRGEYHIDTRLRGVLVARHTTRLSQEPAARAAFAAACEVSPALWVLTGEAIDGADISEVMS